jgi:hypothetical protein
MEEIAVGAGSEVSRVIASVCNAHYDDNAPPTLAGRLARLHQSVWEAVVAGGPAQATLEGLRRQASRLFEADALIARCDHKVIWELTPVIAATLACGPGEDQVRLRDISNALHQLLQEGLAPGAHAPRAAA